MPPSSAAPIKWPCYAVVSYRPSLLTWALLTASSRVKATWEAQRKMAYGDVSPEMFAKFAAEFAGNFAPSVKVSVNPKSKVRHTALKWTRAQCTPSRSAKIRHLIKFFSISMSILAFILILSRIIFRCLHHTLSCTGQHYRHTYAQRHGNSRQDQRSRVLLQIPWVYLGR